MSGRQFFRFGLRDLLLATLVAAVALAWWVDRRRTNSLIRLQELRIEQLMDERGKWLLATVPAESLEQLPGMTTPNDVVTFVRSNGDWQDFQTALAEVRDQPAARDAVPELVDLLSSGDAETRTRAASSLAQIKHDGRLAVPALVKLLDDEVPNVRWHAANALGELGPKSISAVPALRKQMDDDDSPVAAWCAAAVVRIDPEQQVGERLLQLLTSRNATNRSTAIREVRRHVSADVARQALTRAFMTETDPENQKEIAAALNGLEQ